MFTEVNNIEVKVRVTEVKFNITEANVRVA